MVICEEMNSDLPSFYVLLSQMYSESENESSEYQDNAQNKSTLYDAEANDFYELEQGDVLVSTVAAESELQAKSEFKLPIFTNDDIHDLQHYTITAHKWVDKLLEGSAPCQGCSRATLDDYVAWCLDILVCDSMLYPKMQN
jgi:hypothetical protein